LLFAIGLTFSLSGCKDLDGLELDIEDPEDGKKSGNGEKPDPGTEPAPTKPDVIDASNPSIKAKFGIDSTGTDGVKKTFNTLSAYIQAGGLEDENNVIRLGDWIDLEGGLTVGAYDGWGSFTATNTDLGSDKGYLLRLIVVGINSFHSGRGMIDSNTITQNGDTNGKYDITDNDATPHVVFQFQNIPVKHRMNSTDTNAGGYAASKMRSYVTGNFLAGLKNAGVPEGTLWAPKRIVSLRNGQGELEDLLWLPTEREMFGKNANSVSADETEENQARLEYYDSNGKRKKHLGDSSSMRYWLASPSYREVYSGVNRVFCAVGGTYGATDYNEAGAYHGCVPAFCVRGKKPEPGAEPAPTKPAVIENAANAPSIKAKFGIQSAGKVGVEDTFTTLHAYIQAGGLEDGVIKLEDWIDLEGGIEVGAYNGKGAFSYTPEQAKEPVTWTLADGDNYFSSRDKDPRGTRCRLIVVGINSFNGKNGNTTPHVVFQFQNIPVVTRKMNSGLTNAGGYAASEMRKYLVEVGNSGADPNDGKFLAGLLEAGVPEEALWAPKRFVSVKGAEPGELEDLLWLPTERELFGSNTYSVSADETEANQARLEYYDSNEKRLKFFVEDSVDIIDSYGGAWWTASPALADVFFCGIKSDGKLDTFNSYYEYGCVPAFCVR
jgi:hypothetical protein